MAITARNSEAPGPGLPFSTLSLIDSLIHTSILEEDKKTEIELTVEELTEEEAGVLITFLYENQKESLDQQYKRALRNDSDPDFN